MRIITIILALALPAVATSQTLWSEDRGAVDVDRSLLERVLDDRASSFTIEAGGSRYAVAVTGVSRSPIGVRSLSGSMGDPATTWFLLCATDDGDVVAMFRPVEGPAYRLEMRDGRPALRVVDDDGAGACGGGVALPGVPVDAGRSALRTDEPAGDRAGETADDGSRHDILMAYTAMADTVWGFAARAECQLAVDAANLAYANSGIASRLRLVHVMSTDYAENTVWDYEDHLTRLWDPADGRMDAVLAMREMVGADFISVLIDGRDVWGNVTTCGIGYVMGTEWIGPQFQEGALSIVSVQCAAEKWTLAHEVGHNRGCAHNREDATVLGAYDYAFGHRFFAGSTGLRTVMSYDDASGTYARIPHFSNPDVDYAFEPTGVAIGLADEAHNAQVHANTAGVCADFRMERTLCTSAGGARPPACTPLRSRPSLVRWRRGVRAAPSRSGTGARSSPVCSTGRGPTSARWRGAWCSGGTDRFHKAPWRRLRSSDRSRFIEWKAV